MAESQPGAVETFDPSINLTSFSAKTRDKLIFNENQLVLAKVQQPRPVFAAALTAVASSTLTYTRWGNYKNLSGDFAYIDGSFQALDTPGVPTGDVFRIEIGFDQQVVTNILKFWSTGFVDTTKIKVEYSFDNVTYFSAGTVSWVQNFDDTIEVFPGDNPPTGEYVYTGTIGSGEITARYWRIRSDLAAAYVSGTSTMTVDSTSGFPSSGFLYVGVPNTSIVGGYTILDILSYTGKTSTTFTGVQKSGGTPDPLVAGSYLITAAYPFGSGVTEVNIIPTLSPILEHWNSDGTKAVTHAVEGKDYYDICYDKTDDVYYAIRFNDTLSGAVLADPNDDFDADTGANFDSTKWNESLTNVYFQHSTASGTLRHLSSAGAGQLTTTYGLGGSFTASVDLVAAIELNQDAYFSLEAVSYDNNNHYLLSALKGPYTPGVDTSGSFVRAAVSYSDTVGSAAVLSDFHVNTAGMDFSFAGGVVSYSLLYNSSFGEYDVTVSGITHPRAKPGVKYSLDSAEFTISNLSTPANGQGFQVDVKVLEVPNVGTAASGIQLTIQRAGSTNGYAGYTDTNAPGSPVSTFVGNVPSDTVAIQLYGSPEAQSIDLSADNYVVTYDTLVFDTPVFSVLTINKSGNIEQVVGVSDVDGYVIKSFDIIRDTTAIYNQYLAPRVAIATNGGSGGAGEVYIKVNDTIYKYLKSSLPLASDNGTSASVVTVGEIPATGVTAFEYNGYSGGGLSYIEYEQDLSGTFVKSINTVNLTATELKALLDVNSIDYRFAWNVSDLSTLYYVDGTSLKLYDLNETKAAFVNVTSNKQVLAAGTAETATITAQVLNVYGQVKSNKSMVFSVSAGDGAISPAVGCSDVNGEDTTTYTVGSAVGPATITVTVSDITC